MSAPTRRTQRVATLIRAELARILREDINDPSLTPLHINDVDLSPDLKHARVFFSLDENPFKPKEIEKGLSRALPFFRRKLGDNLDLRYVPELRFEKDTHGDTVARVFHLIEGSGTGTSEDLDSR